MMLLLLRSVMSPILLKLSLLAYLYCMIVESEDDGYRRKLGRKVEFIPSFGRIESVNVPAKCRMPNGDDICCVAFDEITDTRGVGAEHNSSYPSFFQLDDPFYAVSGASVIGTPVQCKYNKTYVSSPYELSQFAITRDIGNISDELERYKFIVDYLWKEESISNATRWLARVAAHMKSPEIAPETPDDFEYLSRFIVTGRCSNGRSFQWNEWIEPITIHARNPFSIYGCKMFKHLKGVRPVHIMNADYVLLQSGQALRNMDILRSLEAKTTTTISQGVGGTAMGGNINKRGGGAHRTAAGKRSRGGRGGGSAVGPAATPKRILLDAGSSVFGSSTWWFACAYAQRGISFDSVHAWEYSLIDPVEYWEGVPPRWKPFVQFLNVPLTNSSTHSNSPYQFIRRRGSHDFVSFKLDVDNIDVEMPLALELARNKKVASLIDEFFFELHFMCEIMRRCGWGHLREKFEDTFIMDRANTLQYFLELRKLGIRSHIWP